MYRPRLEQAPRNLAKDHLSLRPCWGRRDADRDRLLPLAIGPNEIRARFVMPLMIVAYTAIVAAGADEQAFPWKGSIYRSMVWLGERSYSVYLFHLPVMAAIWFGLISFAPPIWTIEPLHYGVAQMSLALLIVLPLSSLSLRWVENPARHLRWRRKDSSAPPKTVLVADAQ